MGVIKFLLLLICNYHPTYNISTKEVIMDAIFFGLDWTSWKFPKLDTATIDRRFFKPLGALISLFGAPKSVKKTLKNAKTVENAYKHVKGELDLFRVKDLQKVTEGLKNFDPSKKESLETFAQTTLILKTYAAFFGKTIPLAGLLVPLSQLYFKKDSVNKSFAEWMESNSWNEGVQRLVKLIKTSASCLISALQLLAYGIFFFSPEIFIFPLAATLALITLYECYQEECKENPDFKLPF